MSEENWVEVARVDEIPARGACGVEVAGRRIALVRFEGAIYALDARCPHMGGPLDQGEIYLGALVCPWHNFRYDPRTGANVFPANVYPDDLPYLREQIKSAEVYPVKVEAGRVLVLWPAKG
jgi:nitrite reductase/ring-hydroxylating ferredoxin subunit